MAKLKQTANVVTLNSISMAYPQSACVQFLVNRFQAKKYRGVHATQHNRYTIAEIKTILSEIHKLVGLSQMKIRTTDLSKYPQTMPGTNDYVQLVQTIKKNPNFKKGTEDSIRKNLFVDMHRMGLLSRYDKRRNPKGPYENGTKQYVALTQDAIDFINTMPGSSSEMWRFSRAVGSLMNGYNDIIRSVMVELKTDHITRDELMLFTSFADCELNGTIYGLSNIVDLIRDWRTLAKSQRANIKQMLANYCNPRTFSGSKTDKKDWQNLKNETEQVICILCQSVYFDYDVQKEELVEKGTVGGQKFKGKFKRSQIVKKDYFTKHNITTQTGFELHHIVPLYRAKSLADWAILDSWDNLIYIDAYSHAQITQAGSQKTTIKFNGVNAVFSDALSNVTCILPRNVLYNVSLQSQMLAKNKSANMI